VAAYLREPDGAMAELSAQLRAYLLEALPDGADDDSVREVLAALGPATRAAHAAALPGSVRGGQPSLRQPLVRRTASRARRVSRAWISLAVLVIVVGGPAGALIYWQAQSAVT
jgi:hypothetical protein